MTGVATIENEASSQVGNGPDKPRGRLNRFNGLRSKHITYPRLALFLPSSSLDLLRLRLASTFVRVVPVESSLSLPVRTTSDRVVPGAGSHFLSDLPARGASDTLALATPVRPSESSGVVDPVASSSSPLAACVSRSDASSTPRTSTMTVTHPMPDPSPARPSRSTWRPWMTTPRSPTWERPGTSHEPMDPTMDVISEAIEAALDALADAELYGSEADVEAAEARLERYQRVVVRHNREEDDQRDGDFEGVDDDWSDVTWIDDAEDEHGAQ